jgi:hypothetical protein
MNSKTLYKIIKQINPRDNFDIYVNNVKLEKEHITKENFKVNITVAEEKPVKKERTQRVEPEWTKPGWVEPESPPSRLDD